jgi:hypothetical protein
MTGVHFLTKGQVGPIVSPVMLRTLRHAIAEVGHRLQRPRRLIPVYPSEFETGVLQLAAERGLRM